MRLGETAMRALHAADRRAAVSELQWHISCRMS
jgi:hypothetical protein